MRRVRLLGGEHIQPGARYRITSRTDDVGPLELKVEAWDSAGLSRLEFSSPDDVRTGWAELDSAQKPTVVRGAFAGEYNGFAALTCAAEGDFDRRWAGVGGSSEHAPAFTATADHHLGEGILSIAGSPGKGD